MIVLAESLPWIPSFILTIAHCDSNQLLLLHTCHCPSLSLPSPVLFVLHVVLEGLLYTNNVQLIK